MNIYKILIKLIFIIKNFRFNIFKKILKMLHTNNKNTIGEHLKSLTPEERKEQKKIFMPSWEDEVWDDEIREESPKSKLSEIKISENDTHIV